jgi:sarcosine oxidase
MRHVREEEWPRLERAAGTALIQPLDVVFYGHDRALLAGYAAAVQAAGVAVDRLSVGEARQRFPALKFGDDAEVLHDRTGGTIAADETIRALHRLVVGGGAAVLDDTRVRAIDRAGDAIRIDSDRGVLETERVVVAAGAWLPELVPAVRASLTVVPQTVAYVRLGVPARTVPSWIHFGGVSDGITYGLAEVGRDALKVGLHVTHGPGADPDEVGAPTAAALEALRARLARILAVPVRELLGGEPCLYTMTATEDFLIDTWPGDGRLVFVSACSGHGFKFAPLTGRIAAELLLDGKADLPGGLDAAALFGQPRPPAPRPSWVRTPPEDPGPAGD